MNFEGIEIMSPVGSYESLMGAIQAGAGSVYFGIGVLNMRSRSSSNFNLNDLNKISSICNENQVKSYVALNTVVYDEDMAQMREIIDAVSSNHISAVIVSDQAVINYARTKNVEIHLSTQLNISNFDSLKFYSRYADVAVLARELTLNQISEINQSINREKLTGPSGKLMRTEVFVHGALCMSVSGKCFLSLHSHNTSANRGECYQICRRQFTVFDETGLELKLDNNYILSPKDLCTIGILDKIINSGVTILKIEGRGRSPEYVYTTTKVYREAVDSILSGRYSLSAVQYWLNELKTVYNRGFYEGHYLGKNAIYWNTNIYGSKANKIKIYIAKVIKYFSKLKVGEFLMESGELNMGDKILILGPTTGLYYSIVTEIRVDNIPVNQVLKGLVFSMPVEIKIRPSDKVYLISENSQKNKLE